VPLADVFESVKDLELGTPEGFVNVIVLGLISGGFIAPTFLRAAGALVDRIIYLVLVLKNRPAPNRLLAPFVEPRASLYEAGVVALVGGLCFAGLGLTH
jgi:hypothetical protein